jgi:hypothetical protein
MNAGEPSVKRPVVHERYDEFVFNQPSDSLLQRIQMCNSRLVGKSHRSEVPPGGCV